MDVTVEDVAACKKRLSITIPREEIEQKFNERFNELEREALVPGFRPGRAPRRLIEKRFRDAVAEEVRAKLVSEGFEKAIDEQKLDVIGEPEIDPEKIELPDEGAMTFSIDLEVRPQFDLPADYSAIAVDQVERPQVTDETVARGLDRLRKQHGRIYPLPEGGEARENDLVSCGLTIQAGDVMVVDHQNVRLPVAAIAIEGIRLNNLPDLLKGAKAGDVRTAAITIGDDADNEDVRGKAAELRVKVDTIARVALPDDAALLAAVDYEDMDSLRASLRRQQEAQSDNAFRRAQETAVQDWLLAAVPFDLPEDLAKRHANRLLQRQLVDLQYRGIPVEEIEKRMADIRGASTERAARDLKLHFILDAIAKKEKIEATDAEVDARLRFIAVQYGRKEDRVREEMAAEGTLDSLRGQILEDKVLRMLLEKPAAKAEPADAAADTQTTAETDPATPPDEGPADAT